MSARMAQTPPSAYTPVGMTDCMAECNECHIEWAWGAPVEKIEEYVAEHNVTFHPVSPEKKAGTE